jgi:glycine dehydrogenase subunit 1
VIRLPRSMRRVNAELLKEKIIGPLALGCYYPKLAKCGLVCVTETTSREEIDRLAAALGKILSGSAAPREAEPAVKQTGGGD